MTRCLSISDTRQRLFLTDRCVRLLCFVYESGGCTIDHIHARLWDLGSSKVTCYRRVAQLIGAEYLDARRLPSLSGQGSGKYLLTLGREGRVLLADLYDVPVNQLRQRRLAAPQQIDHHFAVVSARTTFELACETIPHVSLSRFESEPYSRRAPLRVTDTYTHGTTTRTRSIPLAPDAVFSLVLPNAQQDFFLEVDRATISAASPRLLAKIRGYLRYQQQHSVPVLYIVPNQVRVQRILGLVLLQSAELRVDPRRILATTRVQLCPQTVLTAPQWHQPGVSSPVALLPPAPSIQVSE